MWSVSIRHSERVAEADITASAGAVGDSGDNALAKAVNSHQRAELIHVRPARPSRTEAEVKAMQWVS